MKLSQKAKDKLHRLEILLSISVLLVLFGVFSIGRLGNTTKGNLITAFVSSDIFTQNVDIEIDRSQSYYLSSEPEFKLTSLRLTGVVEGSGIVRILIEDSEGKQLLIYTNIKDKNPRNLITGYAVAEGNLAISPSKEALSPLNEQLPEDKIAVSGQFYNECVESCFMSAIISPQGNAKLIFQLEEGAKVKLTGLSYTNE